MTTDDLAGLLAEHRSWRAREWEGAYCTCGEHLVSSIQPNDAYPALAAHQAAVIAVAGWVKGREEWGTRDRNGHVRSHLFKANAEEWAEIDHREVVRRHVTDWEPVE